MPAAVYYLPDAPSSILPNIQATLRALHARLHHSRFTLEHRLFRSTPGPSTAPALLHILTLAHRSHTHLYAHPSDSSNTSGNRNSSDSGGGHNNRASGNIIAIPTTHANEYRDLLVGKMSGLWAPRSALSVAGGEVWSLGSADADGDVDAAAYVMRIGEVRTLGTNAQPRGVIIVVEEGIGIEGDEDEEDEAWDIDVQGGGPGGEEEEEMGKKVEVAAAASLMGLREVWEKIGVKGAKETVGRFARGERRREEAEVRMWCEVLKLRN
ncbi:hypothetical protein EJ05DRAFT_472403 [Pseudovirgaria hyperparasitica]|uniref:Mediator of RNA polymerase II transcription subunit 20 n=1 Tax=Pseudovirgaria hyperparasitica TaxID=470096 RepID=A0A6A6WN90_9PEZI|nr:uncharacterized protein EJ05DRAFT_472403 [Pseudovirgaria hyperparasitica]KAF2763509.1 hypothetical protein EJ05DRAFT_472403 [Pseudovirgaria hyperparasitica]